MWPRARECRGFTFMLLSVEEYQQYLRLCEQCEHSGNDGADVYEADSFCKTMEEKYGKPFNILLSETPSKQIC